MDRLSRAEIICYLLFGEPRPALCEVPNVCVRTGPGLFDSLTSATNSPIGCWPYDPPIVPGGDFDLPFALWSAPENQREAAHYLLGGGFVATNYGIFVDCSVPEEQITAAVPQEIRSDTIWAGVPGIVERLGWAAIPVNPDFTMLVLATSTKAQNILETFRIRCDQHDLKQGSVLRVGGTVEVQGVLAGLDVEQIARELESRLGYDPFIRKP